MSPMRGRALAHRKWASPSFVLCLFVLCVAPYLLDIVICEEVSTSKFHQPALVDGEEVDPSEGPGVSTSYVHHDQALSTLSSVCGDQRAVIDSFPEVSLPICFSVASLISRPPPIS